MFVKSCRRGFRAATVSVGAACSGSVLSPGVNTWIVRSTYRVGHAHTVRAGSWWKRGRATRGGTTHHNYLVQVACDIHRGEPWSCSESSDLHASLGQVLEGLRPRLCPVDDYVHLVHARFHGRRDIGQLDRRRGPPGRERGSDRGDRDGRDGRDGRTSQLPAGHGDRVRVYADSRDRQDRRVSGSGWRTLARSPATLPGVSAPSSVVRSTIGTAASRAHSLASRLMDLVASAAARSWSPADPPWQPMRQLSHLRISDRAARRPETRAPPRPQQPPVPRRGGHGAALGHGPDLRQ